MSENQNYINILLQTLEKQQATLQEVLQITKEQNQIAGKDDFEETMLEASLNQKDILIARLNELDDGFVSVYGWVRNEIADHKEQYSSELAQMQKLIKQCTDLGVEIKVLEERNKERLTQCFVGKHKQYSMKQTAATVASRYHQTMHPRAETGSRFTS